MPKGNWFTRQAARAAEDVKSLPEWLRAPEEKGRTQDEDIWVGCAECGENSLVFGHSDRENQFEWTCPKCGTHSIVERVLYWVSMEV